MCKLQLDGKKTWHIFSLQKRLMLTLYRMVMPIGTPFLKEKINN